MNEETMKQRIKEKYDDMSAKEKIVAKYIIDNYHQSMLLSSGELAELAGVSDTAVIRFAKALGFKGFLEYKNTIKKEYVPTQKVYSSLALIDHDSEGKVVNRYLGGLMEEMGHFASTLNIQALSEMADQIMKAKNVYLAGFGSDEVVVCFLKNYLNLMGVQCITISEEGLALREKMFHLSSEDVVFLSAYPTLMDSEVWIADFVKKRGARLLLMTDSEITARHLQADVFLAFNEAADNFFNSYVLQMACCNALLLQIYEMYPNETAAQMKRYEDMLSE